MSNIQVNRGETKLGIFSEDEIREGLKSGRFLPSDLWWREGMTTWQSLSEFPDLTTQGTIAASSAPPPPAGLPWDRRGELGFFPAFFETLKLVLLNPTVAFTSMKREGGLAEPLIYALCGGCVGFLFYFLFSMLVSSFGLMAGRDPLTNLLGLGFGTVATVICIPILVVLGLFVGSAILHLCLLLVGGAKHTFETTFRVVCFSTGSTYPLMILPICGGLISGVWCLVTECIGVAKAHETDTGRAVLAVFLPVIVCCGGGFLLALMFGFLGAVTGQH
jgi:hypothetical protein